MSEAEVESKKSMTPTIDGIRETTENLLKRSRDVRTKTIQTVNSLVGIAEPTDEKSKEKAEAGAVFHVRMLDLLNSIDINLRRISDSLDRL